MHMKEIKQYCHSRTLNPISEHVTMYPIKEGCKFNEMDIVVLSKETLHVSHPEQSNKYITVGRAIKTIKSESGSNILLCRDGVIMFKNSFDISEYTVQVEDVGKNCYLENEKYVSMNSKKRTVAGRILSVVEDSVIVRIDIYEGEE